MRILMNLSYTNENKINNAIYKIQKKLYLRMHQISSVF